jgi:SAM-dependent methyltransferase
MTTADGPDAGVLASQREFYDLRAPDYLDDTWPDRRGRGVVDAGVMRAVVDAFRPTGDVLELACGTGLFTRELARHARSVTALDASPRMIERSRAEHQAENVHYVVADLFAWEPDRTYDDVFFGHWLSHVPPASFAGFWEMVRRCLGPRARVAFFDEGDRASGHDTVRLADGVPVAARTLRDGRTFDVVKVFWDPDELAARLRTLGWDVFIARVEPSSFYGIAVDAR